ncbi:hypothetical protein R1flu_027614 [Riccia fluitans]|uniref:F-box domain-containing protein n=1 Tax=Riccia fluitans TaxID=41844 RepID=A0ABD1XMA6_9MARC
MVGEIGDADARVGEGDKGGGGEGGGKRSDFPFSILLLSSYRRESLQRHASSSSSLINSLARPDALCSVFLPLLLLSSTTTTTTTPVSTRFCSFSAVICKFSLWPDRNQRHVKAGRFESWHTSPLHKHMDEGQLVSPIPPLSTFKFIAEKFLHNGARIVVEVRGQCIRRRSEEAVAAAAAGTPLFVSSQTVIAPKTSSILGNEHGFVMDVAPATAPGATDWYLSSTNNRYGLESQQQQEFYDPEDMPQQAVWFGEEIFFLGNRYTTSISRSKNDYGSEFVSGNKKTARRKLSREMNNSTECEKPTEDLINLLPDECLFEIFRSLSRARDRCAVAAVCRRWLLLQSTLPRSALRARVANVPPEPGHASSLHAESGARCEVGAGDERVERQPQWAIGDLTRKLEGRKATDIRLACIAVGTAGRGGLGELVIKGGHGLPFFKDVSDIGLTAIGMSCGALRRLSLWHCLSVGDEGLIAIGRGCRLLEKVHLLKCPGIGDAGLKTVAEGCPLLSNVNLDSCKRIGNEGLKSIGRSSSNLIALSISNCDVGSEGIVAVVSGCRKLKKMKLERVNINDTGLEQSPCLQELRDLGISSCKGLSDRALQVIGESCKQLRVFSLLNCDAASDTGLKAMTKSCLALESLQIEGCSGITHIGLKAALANRGGELKTLRLNNCSGVRDKGLTSSDFLLTCNALKSLSITNCIGVGSVCLEMVGRSCPALEELDLTGLTGVSDRGLKALLEQGVGMQLRKLNLSGCVKVTDIGVYAVARQCKRKLRSLILEGCTRVTDGSLKLLATECQGIEDLDVSKCSVTDEGVEAMVSENGKALKSLSLAGCKLITDRSVYAIGNGVCSDSFWALNVKQCQGVSREALDEFETRFFNVLLCRSS